MTLGVEGVEVMVIRGVGVLRGVPDVPPQSNNRTSASTLMMSRPPRRRWLRRCC